MLDTAQVRVELANPGQALNDMTNPNWTNAVGKYLILRPRPADHPPLGGKPGFPNPEDEYGDVRNLPGSDTLLRGQSPTFYEPIFPYDGHSAVLLLLTTS